MAGMADLLQQLPVRNPMRPGVAAPGIDEAEMMMPSGEMSSPAAEVLPQVAAAVQQGKLSTDEMRRIALDLGLGGIPDLLATLGNHMFSDNRADGLSFDERLNKRRTETESLYSRLPPDRAAMIPDLQGASMLAHMLLGGSAAFGGAKALGAGRGTQIAAPAIASGAAGYSGPYDASTGERAAYGAAGGTMGAFGGRLGAGAKQPKRPADPELRTMFQKDPAAVIESQIDPNRGRQAGTDTPTTEAIKRLVKPLQLSEKEIKAALQAQAIKLKVKASSASSTAPVTPAGGDRHSALNERAKALAAERAAAGRQQAQIQQPKPAPQPAAKSQADAGTGSNPGTAKTRRLGERLKARGTGATSTKPAKTNTASNQNEPSSPPVSKSQSNTSTVKEKSTRFKMPPPEPTVEGVRDSVKSAGRARKMAHVHTDANGVKHDKGTGQFLDETGSNKLIRQSGGDKHAALNEKARALAGGRQKAGANRSWKSKADRKAFEAWAKNTGHEIGPEAWDKFNKLGGSK